MTNDTNIDSVESELKTKYLNNKNVIIVGNKSDLKVDNKLINYFSSKNHFTMSGINEKDIHKLNDLISNFISKNLIREDSSIMINERHYSCLNKVKESIENVKKNIANKSNTDLLAMDIKYALNHLGEITGEITNDEILGNIFSKFCIGK